MLTDAPIAIPIPTGLVVMTSGVELVVPGVAAKDATGESTIHW